MITNLLKNYYPEFEDQFLGEGDHNWGKDLDTRKVIATLTIILKTKRQEVKYQEVKLSSAFR